MREDIRRLEDNELRDIVDEKIRALVRELQDADWNAQDVVKTIRDVLEETWLKDVQALQNAKHEVPLNFISDGNEG